MRASILCCLILLWAGCDTTMAVDAGGEADVPRLDAPGLDVPTVDVPALDTRAADAPLAVDAPGMTDTAMTADGGSCANSSTGIGASCTMDSECPTGFTCQGFSGVVFTQSCQIRCDLTSCPCPDGTTCTMVGDKGGTWMQCAPL